MPFVVNRDAEFHWRTRYRLQSGVRERPHPASHAAARAVDSRAPSGDVSDAPQRLFAWPRPHWWWAWLAVSLSILGGGIALVTSGERGVAIWTAPAGHDAARMADGDFETVRAALSTSRETSLVALRGYMLTGGAGFGAEWRDAVARLQAATNALEIQSMSWTDGLMLVQLVEMRRLVDGLVEEQQAVAALIGTAGRYPGLQLLNEDVRPALDEAQRICVEVLDVMLAVSSPEDAGAIGPFAKLRGDLDGLRAALSRYASGREALPPAAARPAELSTMLNEVAAARAGAPAAVQPKIDRIVLLLQTAQEKLEQALSLHVHRDEAEHAYATRVVPLAEALQRVVAAWVGAR
ncbi:MAG: hypothetical protein Q7V31_02505 [Parvibaculum sp.]|uniref:hypothetical protein n=1 Tax=Parvibaculum sp. TaxID=2024848 RepID=UPI002718BC6E|nr:hypothetical protein [Parvibaculum sp.]MDO8837772.1 hypothetical protein [Parvibaculum sp.]